MHSNNKLDTDTYSIQCLGVGNGSSHVLKGLPSTSFLILKNRKPEILVDCGLGILKSFLDYYPIEEFPDKIFITHNHTDHTGDLPVVLALYSKLNNSKPTIIGHEIILSIVKKHRLDELYVNGKKHDDYAFWLGQSKAHTIVLNNMTFELFKSQHSYICYGFSLFINKENVLGYTADSGYNSDVYLSVGSSPIIIADGRDKGSYEHASLAEIDSYATSYHSSKIYVVHFENSDYNFSSPNVFFWRKGSIIDIFED